MTGTATGKRLLTAWMDGAVCPSNLVNVFAFDDDYHFGILSSRIHERWARAQSSTLKADLRYTPTSAFETFPFPDPVAPPDRERVADLARQLDETRRALCVEHKFGLTALYNLMDDGGVRHLAKIHHDLDEAVARCYGWPATVAHDPDETNRRLLDLNGEIAAGRRPYSPFAHAPLQKADRP